MDLHALFLRERPDGQSLFDLFLSECQKWYDEPAHTFTEMRTRDNKKIRGDVFEEFCVKYLKHVRKLSNVWLLKDVPEDILTTLSLKRPDVGIDIIAEHEGKYYAVQVQEARIPQEECGDMEAVIHLLRVGAANGTLGTVYRHDKL